MTKSPIRIPINNILLGNDYTGKLYVGSKRKEVNLLLDTGSSTLAIDHKRYDPRQDPNAKVTKLVQEVAYGDGSNWIGSVVNTDVTASAGSVDVDLPGVAVAVAYHETVSMFGKADGILGLAYESLDDAVEIDKDTVPPHYSPNDIRAGSRTFVQPYFMQLESAGIVANKFAFYSRRSVVRASKDPAADPANGGYLILGGGEEAKDLYTGPFQSAPVFSDDWYSVKLKQVIVGSASPIPVKSPSPQSHAPTNAIVDSGTNGLDLAPALFDAILSAVTPQQVKLIRSRQVSNQDLRLAEWPTITFILDGGESQVRLDVSPQHYWQLDAFETGNAYCCLWRGDGEQSILGLPLMNAYYTVFDCSANHGLGVVRFATPKVAAAETAYEKVLHATGVK